MSDETTPDLTALLSEHGPSGFVNSREGWVGCECGARLHLPSGLTFDGYAEMWDEEQAARAVHLAEQIIAAGFGPVRAVQAERDSLAWAEMLTHQECVAKKHPDRFIDSEHNIVCPWCRAESAEAALAGLREGIEALASEWASRPDDADYCGDHARALRRLLATTPDREEARDE